MHSHIKLSSDVEEASRKKMPKRMIEFEWKKMSKDFCNNYGYKKEPLNNALKKELSITHLTPQARPIVLHNLLEVGASN